MTPTFDELRDLVESAEFKARCADVRARQEAGEDFDAAALVDALGLPRELVSFWMLAQADKMLARVVVPAEGQMQ